MNKHMNKKWAIAALLCGALCLSGCSSLPSWMGGKKEEKAKLAGERISVLPVATELKPDVDPKDPIVSVPEAKANQDWPEQTGVFSAATGNLAAGGNFEHMIQATVGDGNSYEHMLVVRPVVGGGLVFVMDAAGHVSAHDAADVANVRWKSKGVAEEDDPQNFGGGLAYDQGRLYAVSGRGVVAALDATTGKEIWHKALHTPLRSAPAVAGGRIFIISLDNQVFALNTRDGDIAWSQRGISETTGLMGIVSPTVTGEEVIVPYSSGEIYALAQATGKEIWSESLTPGKTAQASAFFGGIGGNPVVDDNVVISVSSGGMIAVQSINTGQHVWERPIGSMNTPWLAGNFIYVLTTDNTLVCTVKFNGHIRWATQLANFADEDKKEPILWKGPVMVGGKLAVVGSHGKLQMVSALDGKMLAAQDIPEHIYTAPVVAGGRMYLVSQDATLYELQ